MAVITRGTVKLSELPADTKLSYEDADFTITAAELREDPESYEKKWYVVSERRWRPDAKEMIERYIENEYDNGMYEDWDDLALDCLKQDHYDRIQAILDEAFEGDYATKYWVLDGPAVEIDC